MYNLFTLAVIGCWVMAVYFFYRIFYNKLKLHNLRLKMQERGEIDDSKNISAITLRSFILWPLAATKFKALNNQEHKQRMKRVNNALLGLLAAIIAFAILNIVIKQ